MITNVLRKARNVLPTSRWARRWGVPLSLVIVLGVFIPAVRAVHDTGLFELDGNAVSNLIDDWDRVCYQVTGSAACGTTTGTTGAIATAWTGDCEIGSAGIGCADANATLFVGGGSKDPQDVSAWAWKDGAGGLPDKDNLVHAFAVRYSVPSSANCPSGSTDPTVPCDVVYFGSDRFDNSGDAQQGFWFMQNKITLGTNKVGGALGFQGLHKAGDLLVISDFSNGGTTSTISIFKWDPTCLAANKPDASCADANLRTLASSDSANCNTVGSNDAFCGIVNTTAVSTPWSTDYTDKSGNNSYLAGEFYEAGVNLSLLGLANECFSSVVSETRSSTSTTATLKDFVLGSFAVCVPGLTTLASASTASPVTPGTAVTDTATLKISGGGVTTAPDPTGSVTFFLCGPIATGDCSTGGLNIGTATLDGGSNTTDGTATATSPTVNDSTQTGNRGPLTPGRYCFRAEWPGDSNYPGTSHTDSTDECFAVKDTSTITTNQNWLPNDSAIVSTAGGTTVSGTVVFTLYGSANCTGTVLGTFTDTTAPFATDNTTVYTASTTISWRAVFTPSDPNAVAGSTARCETSTLTINNDIGS
jgi:hypothetical protein